MQVQSYNYSACVEVNEQLHMFILNLYLVSDRFSLSEVAVYTEKAFQWHSGKPPASTFHLTLADMELQT